MREGPDWFAGKDANAREPSNLLSAQPPCGVGRLAAGVEGEGVSVGGGGNAIELLAVGAEASVGRDVVGAGATAAAEAADTEVDAADGEAFAGRELPPPVGGHEPARQGVLHAAPHRRRPVRYPVQRDVLAVPRPVPPPQRDQRVRRHEEQDQRDDGRDHESLRFGEGGGAGLCRAR